MTTTHCPKCGAAMPANAPEGLCRPCLLEQALVAEDKSLTQINSGAPDRSDSGHGVHAGSALGSFGDYELLEEIARGGMGIVYKARQISLKRTVAVKLILAGQFAGKQHVQRFRGEATAAAILHHPNIVAVHEVGTCNGQHFFSMDYVDGQNLSQLVANRPLPSHQAARYLKLIAEAIHYAHQQGILHRDLKPSNVLVDAATDQPRVTDFGLAKRLDGEASITVTGQILGSPNFMPPEQASSARGKVGRNSDVYGLGAILFYTLTARAPFQGATLETIIHEVLNSEPLSPRTLNPSVPPDLETICLKCLEKEPSRRYSSAQELAEKLDRFLKDEPIHARPVSRTERVWRWCRRKPALAASILLVLLLLLLLGIGGPVAAYRINEKGLLAEQNLYTAHMRLASEEANKGAFDHVRQLLTNHIPARSAQDLRGWEWRYLAHIVQKSEPVRAFQGLAAPPEWHSTLLFRAGHFLYNQTEGLDSVMAWDTTNWEPVPIHPPQQPASAKWEWDLALGSAYAVDNAQHTVTIYSLPKFERGPVLRLRGPISKVALSRDRRVLAVGFQEDTAHRVLVWDFESNSPRTTLGSFQAPVRQLVFSRDQTRLAARSSDGMVGIWDLRTLEPLPAPAAMRGQLVDFTPDNKRLLSSAEIWDGNERTIVPVERAWSSGYCYGLSPDAMHFAVGQYDLTILDSHLQVKGTLHGHQSGIRAITFSPDGKLIATASLDQSIRLWDIAELREVGIVGGFGEQVESVEFSADGQNIVSIGASGLLRAHKLSSLWRQGLIARTDEHLGFSRLAISPDQRLLATLSVEGTLALWDRQTRTLVRSNHFPRYTPGSFPDLAFSPDGQRVAWVTGDALRIMLVESGQFVLNEPIDGNRTVNGITFSPDGGEVAFGCGKKIKLYELASGRFEEFADTDYEVNAIDYSSNGAFIVFGDRQGMMTARERAGGTLLSNVKAQSSGVQDLRISPDGKLLAASGQDSTIRLWNLQPDGRLQAHPRYLRGHAGYVALIAFSPDGSRLVSASGDRTLKVWDPQRGTELATLYGHSGLVHCVRFTKDGCTLYSCGDDGEVRVWEAPPLPQVDLSPKAKSTPTKSAPERVWYKAKE